MNPPWRDATTTTQRWQHNKGARVVVLQKLQRDGGDNDDDSITRGARVVMSPKIAERDGGDSAHKEERGSRF